MTDYRWHLVTDNRGDAARKEGRWHTSDHAQWGEEWQYAKRSREHDCKFMYFSYRMWRYPEWWVVSPSYDNTDVLLAPVVFRRISEYSGTLSNSSSPIFIRYPSLWHSYSRPQTKGRFFSLLSWSHLCLISIFHFYHGAERYRQKSPNKNLHISLMGKGPWCALVYI